MTENSKDILKLKGIDPVDIGNFGIFEYAYDLDRLKEVYKICHPIDVQGKYSFLLVDDQRTLSTNEECGKTLINFVYVEFASITDEDTFVYPVFHGYGFSSLDDDSDPELRHIWWGDGGYTFYPHVKSIIEALKILSEEYFKNE